MALVVDDEVQREVQRILTAKDSFGVLEVSPGDSGKEVVLRQYEAKAALFRRLFRNKLAMQAKARLDDAKMRLLDDRFRIKELAQHNTIVRDSAKDRERIAAMESRTKLLEMRAADIEAKAAAAATTTEAT